MDNYLPLIQKQRAYFRSDKTKDTAFRMDALQKLLHAVKKNEVELLVALKQDLNKSEFEAYTTELGIVLKEIRFAMKHLRSWVKPRRVKTPITHFGAGSFIYCEPYGVTLIIAPWNFPFQLAVAPLIGAIAAGNCVVLKPSELTPKTSEVLAKLIEETFPEDYISVVQGSVETSQSLLKEKFDYIFFTGSTAVGKVILESASKYLTPVTLELGGKSPCIVHEDADIKLAAKRIAWGKFMNAGQTCIAPDYLYVHKNIKEKFLARLKESIVEMYGRHPLENRDFTRIVSERHYKRLVSFIPPDDTHIIFGGKWDKEKLLIEPTVIAGVTWDDAVMQDEIFGPILPVLEYDVLADVIEEIKDHPKPLALYLFSESGHVQKTLLSSISYGGGCINDTVYHFTSPYLPFGGVGTSGIGAYHGKGSFDTFSHRKSVLKQTTWFDIPFRYPNVKNGLRIIKLFLK